MLVADRFLGELAVFSEPRWSEAFWIEPFAAMSKSRRKAWSRSGRVEAKIASFKSVDDSSSSSLNLLSKVADSSRLFGLTWAPVLFENMEASIAIHVGRKGAKDSNGTDERLDECTTLPS